jgi:diguanylate cyclase (GGDEF)-like protein
MVILAIMLINDRFHSTLQEKQLWFNRTIIAHILYFISDIAWAAVLSGQLPKTRFLTAAFNFTNYILLSLLAYEWFMYMAAAENMQLVKSKKKRIRLLLPMAVSILVMIAAYAAAPSFWISESGELNSLYYVLMILAPVIYLMAAFILSMVNAKKAETEDKLMYRLIGIYPLGVLGFGLIQTFTLDAPLFCFGCTVMMLFFYIQNMQTQVSVDPLTRLNNKGQISRYLARTHYRENVRIFVMMIDIDRFKQINDTYGHAEGDRALVIVADALKKIDDHIKMPVFIGRFGGDEFTVCVQDPTENEDLPERIAVILREELAEKQEACHLPYDLRISIGCEVLKDENDTMEACLVRADGKLYEYKRAHGTGR